VDLPLGRRTVSLIGVAIFAISFAVKSLHAADLSPAVHTSEQLAGAMTGEYDARAVSITSGHGLLYSDDQDSSDTCQLSHAPGYSIFLSGNYRLLGRSYLTVQLVQNLLNSLSPVVLFLIGGRILSWRIGAIAGLLAATSHHLSYYSNFILPDSLAALPVLIAVLLVADQPLNKKSSAWRFGAAGLLVGLSTWLRANSLILALWAGVFLVVCSPRRRRPALVLGALFVSAWALTVAPITIRNYLVYREFVPVQIGFGITLWEGIGDTDRGRFGGPRSDGEVIAREEVLYNEPRYGYSWCTPDGIQRDRDRVKRSLAIISAHPFWFLGSILRRAETGIQYNAHAPLVFRADDKALAAAGATAREQVSDDDRLAFQRGEWALSAGNLFEWSRRPVRAVQRIAKETLLLFIAAGIIMASIVSRRAAVLMLVVPGYYLLVQSLLHTEFRYTLPMQYFLFFFAAATWCLLAALLVSGLRVLSVRFGGRGPARGQLDRSDA
jgi:hypothetical protein